MNTTLTAALVLGLVMMAFATTAEAQEPVATFSELNSRLRIGDKVWVTDTQGREHHGRLAGLQDASLTLDTASPTTFRVDEVREIRRQRRDSLVNGMLIGFGAGALFGRFTDKGSKCGSDPECLLYPGTYGALGMGLGALADAIVPGREVVVYRAAGGRTPVRLQWRPVMNGRAVGFAFSVSF